MNAGLDPDQARRLTLFVERLLAPPVPAAHQGIARALLGTNYKWRRPDLDFLRQSVCRATVTSAEFARLVALVDEAKGQEASNLADLPAAAAEAFRASGVGLGGQA